MANDEDAAADATADDSYAPPGPRRSTYTPPTGAVPTATDGPAAAEPGDGYDDDDLANALASQFPGPGRTGSIPVTYSASTAQIPDRPAAPEQPSRPLSDLPAPSGPPVIFPEAQNAPGGLPPAPRRRSLADADLLRTVAAADTPGGTLSAMEQLEAQLRLREQEAREFADWQQRMLAIGTPEALRSLDAARPTFTGVVDIVAVPTPPVPTPPVPTPPVPTPPVSNPPVPTPPVAAEAPPLWQPTPAQETPTPPPVSPPIYDLVEPAPQPAVSIPAVSIPAVSIPSMSIPSVSIPIETTPIPGAEPVFIEPTSPLDPELAQINTGSRSLVPAGYSPEPEEPVDATDRAFEELIGAFPVTSGGVAALTPPVGIAPILPPASPRVPTDEVLLSDDEPTALPAFAIEATGAEPTALDNRVGRAARMFWLWFATNSSVLSVAFGGALFSLGMSLRQAVVAAFVGVAISFLPLGLGTLAGKWSGQPTMITSRATFGIGGNAVPAVIAIVSRVFWGAVLLWLIAVSTAHILIGAKLSGPLSEWQLTAISLAVGSIIALLVAVFGYSLFARVQLVLSIVAALLVVGLLAITWPSVHIGTALTVGDGPWILVVTGVVLVFSFFGLIWVNSGGDLARYQRPSSSGAAAALLAPLGATLPAFALIAYGALLAASNKDVAHGLITSPLDTIALMVPVWYPVPLIAATVLSLLSGVVLSIYSGGFALQALGLRIHRAWSSVLVAVLVFAVAILLSLTVTSVVPVFRDLATTLAVPVAAWAGIFSAEMIIRRRRFDSDSLLRRGGVYATVRWVNLIMLFVASAIGYGLTTATIPWLSWQGYLFTRLGVKLSSDLAGTDLGVLAALVFGLFITFIVGVPAIRAQERSLGAAE
jgi:purine-cytosine permease-like protein